MKNKLRIIIELEAEKKRQPKDEALTWCEKRIENYAENIKIVNY